MSFIIYQTNLGKYFTNKGKVIVFNNEQEAMNFANMFYQAYAIPTAMQEIFNNPSLIGDVMNASGLWQILELPKDYDYEIISFEEIKNTKRGDI